MIKPKIWLRDNGHMTAEDANRRGRLSKAHVAIILDAVAKGAQIEGYGVVRPTVATDRPVEAKRTAVDPHRVADVPDMSRDEREVMAFYGTGRDKVEVGMRTVDNNCGSSLTYCRCESPRVWVDHDREVVVNFGPRN